MSGHESSYPIHLKINDQIAQKQDCAFGRTNYNNHNSIIDSIRIIFCPVDNHQKRKQKMNSTKQTSRRQFLKMTGGIAAVYTLGVARSAYAAGTDEIKVALIGCGRRGRGAVLDRIAVGDNMKLVAIADISSERLNLAISTFDKLENKTTKINLPHEHVFNGFDGYKKAIECADQVLITSFPGFHTTHYEYAVQQGKHVFVEKPFCIDAEGYRRCMKANKLAEEKNLTVLSGYQRRHQNSYLEWIKRIQNGDIGNILNTRVYWNAGQISLRAEKKTNETEMSFQTRDWYVFNWLSGDHYLEQHCHNIDVGNWILGKGDPLAHPISCYGLGGRQARRSPWMSPCDCGNIFDHHYVEYRYDNERVMHSQCRQIKQCWTAVTERVQGTAGNGVACSLAPYDKETWNYPKKNNDKSPYIQEHIDQVDAIRNGKKLHEGWFAATSSMIGIMGRMATYSGKEITWEDAVNKGKTIFPYDKELTFDTLPPVLPDADGSYEKSTAIPGIYDPFE